MSAKVIVGTAGWSYQDWNGRVYPTRPGSLFDPLAYLAGYFDLVEVNSTFYRLPDPARGESWLRRVEDNPEFLFLLKAPGAWTHEEIPAGGEELTRFRQLADILSDGGALGGVLLQFPWAFRNNEINRARIARLSEQLEPYRVAVEVRHGSWQRPEWYGYLRQLNCLPVNIDQPRIGDSVALAAEAGAGAAYFRLHGRNQDSWFAPDAGRDQRYDHLYGEQELGEIQGAIARAAQTVATVFVVTNNHYLGQAAVNALQIRHHFLGERVPAPVQLVAHYTQLRGITITRSGEQGDLFTTEG